MTKGTKKRPTKRRKKAMVSLVTGQTITAMNNAAPGQIVWYPTLPPRKTTWVTRTKEALRRIFS